MLYIAYWTTLPKMVKDNHQIGEVLLPEPLKKGVFSVEESLATRRSVRRYSIQFLTLQEVSQLLWATQGITEQRWGFRTAPSAGGTYPLVIYIVIAKDGVKDVPAGVYRYLPEHHSILLLTPGDMRSDLAVAAYDQEWISDAKINIIIAAEYSKTTDKYGDRGFRYVHMEVGHAGQNIYLQAISLNLGTVVIGAFHDEQVQRVVGMPDTEKPLYIAPVGHLECEEYNDPECIFR